MRITYAGIYDELVPLPEHEVVFYHSILRSRLFPEERVLITPSTTGRLAIALAKQGFYCTGVDLDPEMTAVALEKRAALPPELQARLRFVTGDMRRLGEPGPFGAIVVPERGLLCLDEDSRQEAVLGFSRRLRLAGALVFDLSKRKEAPLFCYNTEFQAPWKREHRLLVCEAVEKVGGNGHLIQHIKVLELGAGGDLIRSEHISLDLHFPAADSIGKALKRGRFTAWRLFGDLYCRQGQEEDDYEIWIANRR